MTAARSIWIPAYLLLCVLLGGASAAGLWANVLLQLLAVLLLIAAFLARRETPLGPGARSLVLIGGLVVALILFQLVPLPPAIWTALPGREHVREGFELLGLPLPWLPISLAPYRTIASALWLLPAFAAGLAMLKIGSRGGWIGWSIAAAMVLSVVVGTLQITGGDVSPWYFYRITNYGVNVGFFSNANHMATLLVVTIPFLGALYMVGRGSGRAAQKSAGLLVITAGMFALLLFGLGINGSIAGLGLMLPVAGATLMLMLRRRRIPAWALGLVLLLTAGSVAVIFSGRVDNNLINPDAQTSVVSRFTTFTTSLPAIGDHLPFGSGLGSFQPIYRLYEDPEKVTTVYINHVHSDWLEIPLETGLPGIALLLLFMIWWCRRAVAVWSAPEPDFFARAATIATAAILAHSLVDYPLRTAALSTIFAVCCALMADPRSARPRRKSWPSRRPARHLAAD